MARSRALQISPSTPMTSKARQEGFPLSLLKLPHVLDSGKESAAFGIDISAAPVPQRRYSAEVAGIRKDAGDVVLLFGQRYPDSEELDSLLSIRINPIAAVQLLDSIESMKSPGLANIVSAMNIQTAPLATTFGRPVQMAKTVANLAAIAVSGFETCIDFYHASAFAMIKATKGTELAVEPVVRVDIQTAVFVSLVKELKAIRGTLPLPTA